MPLFISLLKFGLLCQVFLNDAELEAVRNMLLEGAETNSTKILLKMMIALPG